MKKNIKVSNLTRDGNMGASMLLFLKFGGVNENVMLVKGDRVYFIVLSIRSLYFYH
jgi:hypothetical protein